MKKALCTITLTLLLFTACSEPSAEPTEPTEPWSFTEEIERDEYMVHYRTYFSNGLIVDRYTTLKEGDSNDDKN